MVIRNILKNFPFVYAINGRWKAILYKRRYASLRSYYQRTAQEQCIIYREEDVADFVKQRFKLRNIEISPIPKGKLRIFWVGANYAQDSSGIIQGLQKFGEVILFESRLNKYEQIWPSGDNYKTAKEENSQRLLAQIRESLKPGPIHVVIGQMWAHTIAPETLKKLQEMDLIVVNISMDDRHAFRGQKINSKWTGTGGLIGSIDLACTTAKECCLWYLVEIGRAHV